MRNIDTAITKATQIAFHSLPLFIVIIVVLAICFLGYNIYKETMESRKLDEIYMEAIQEKLKKQKEKTNSSDSPTNQE